MYNLEFIETSPQNVVVPDTSNVAAVSSCGIPIPTFPSYIATNSLYLIVGSGGSPLATAAAISAAPVVAVAASS